MAKGTKVMYDKIAQKQDAIQSAISYSGGGGLIGLGAILQDPQSLSLYLGCAVIAVRLIHDLISLYRFIRKPKD